MIQFEFKKVPFTYKEEIKDLARRYKRRIEWIPDYKMWRFTLTDQALSRKRLYEIFDAADRVKCEVRITRTVNGALGEGGCLLGVFDYPGTERETIYRDLFCEPYADIEDVDRVGEIAKDSERRGYMLKNLAEKKRKENDESKRRNRRGS